MIRIDSHVHFWQFNPVRDAWIDSTMAVIQRDFLPEDLLQHNDEASINGLIAVQADQSPEENEFLLSLAKQNPSIKGIVGWIDLQSPNAAQQLEAYAKEPLFKGWRHIVQSEPEDFLYRPHFRNGIGLLAALGYTYDLLIYHHQLTAAIHFVEAFPHQPIVVDHCAKPNLKQQDHRSWEKGIRALAGHPHVYCKLSGLVTEAHFHQWKIDELYQIFDVVFDAFGTQRILFGSDWPVMLLSSDYMQWQDIVNGYLEHFSPEDREAVWSGNAISFYNLEL